MHLQEIESQIIVVCPTAWVVALIRMLSKRG